MLKFLPSQLSYLLSEPELRRNLGAFFRFVALLAALIVAFSLLFHVIMERYEGKEYSYVTGFYWTLTVMTTLGFGDITFQSDVGRLFSILVLAAGVVLLLIMLPFSFIRYFYAPWLEAQIRMQAPREVPLGMSGHVVLCQWDELARGLVERLKVLQIPYFVIEPDPARAGTLVGQGLSVITGDFDARETYAKLNASEALLIVANLNDANNTNVTLTVREEAAKVAVAAIAEDNEAVDVLELSGATHSIALKQRLGEHLAARVSTGKRCAHVLGRYGQLAIAELPIHGTPLEGVRVRDTRIRQETGLSVVGSWERGKLLPADPELVLADHAVAVVCGSDEQISKLDEYLKVGEGADEKPVLVIGGGKVGLAVTKALKARGLEVRVIENDDTVQAELIAVADKVVNGNAAVRSVMMDAGISDVASVVLTTNDDAINIFLAIYCRRLNPNVHIVSRITHERNIEAIHRAGADFVLSYIALGVKQLIAIVQQRDLVLLGEGIDLFVLEIGPRLLSLTLAEAQIGSQTGLTVIGLQRGAVVEPVSGPATLLEQGTQLIAVGSPAARAKYSKLFG